MQNFYESRKTLAHTCAPQICAFLTILSVNIPLFYCIAPTCRAKKLLDRFIGWLGRPDGKAVRYEAVGEVIVQSMEIH